MKRALRRALVFLAFILCVLAVGGWFVRGKMLARPAWYVRRTLDAEYQRAAATSAEQKLIEGFAAARRAQAQEVRERNAHPDAPPTTAPADPIVLEFSEDELNASLNKWKDFFGWQAGVGRYLQEPMILLNDQSIILAATISFKGMSTVISLHFAPHLEEGKLNVDLGALMAGTLPVPRSYFASQLKQVSEAIEERLSQEREKADISPRGWANDDAVDAAMGELLLHALHDQLAEPALFFREPDGGADARNLPVQIIGIEIADKILRLTVRPMNADQREALLQQIRADRPSAGHAP